MAEFTGDVEEEFATDIPIDFSKFTEKQKEELLKAIQTGGTFWFKEVPVIYSGEVTIDVEPSDWH